MNIQEYLLTCLSEEAAELIQVVGKAQRFGLDDNYFDESPREALERELNDLLGVIELMNENDDVDITGWISRDSIEAKKKKVKKFMKYSENKGLLK